MKQIEHADHKEICAVGRRQVLKLLGPGFVLGLFGLVGAPVKAAGLPPVTIYKNPNCGCCGLWSKYLQARGLRVKTLMLEDIYPVKTRAGVPDNLATCHTAFIDGYVVEGHVPLPAISKMLTERPDVLGIAVPGMPAGSPGMPTVNPEPYDVISFDSKGKQAVYMSF